MRSSTLPSALFTATCLAVASAPAQAAGAAQAFGASGAVESIVVTAPRQETIARERQKLAATRNRERNQIRKSTR